MTSKFIFGKNGNVTGRVVTKDNGDQEAYSTDGNQIGRSIKRGDGSLELDKTGNVASRNAGVSSFFGNKKR